MFRRRSYGMHIKDKRDLMVYIYGAKYKRLLLGVSGWRSGGP